LGKKEIQRGVPDLFRKSGMKLINRYRLPVYNSDHVWWQGLDRFRGGFVGDDIPGRGFRRCGSGLRRRGLFGYRLRKLRLNVLGCEARLTREDENE
jgi:hypothetical protein